MNDTEAALAVTRECLDCRVAYPEAVYQAHMSRCPSCRSKRDKGRARNSTKPEREKTDAARERKRRWQKANADPAKALARRAVRSAIEAGRLIAPASCESCGGSPVRSDGRRGVQAHHHMGYQRKLDVMWLCAKCHRQHDDAARAGSKE